MIQTLLAMLFCCRKSTGQQTAKVDTEPAQEPAAEAGEGEGAPAPALAPEAPEAPGDEEVYAPEAPEEAPAAAAALPPKIPYEQVERWNKGLQHMLRSEFGRESLMAFMVKRAEEKLLGFYLAVVEFHALFDSVEDESTRKNRADAISRDFWGVFNVMPAIKMRIQEKKKKPSRDMFDEARAKVYELIQNGAYADFKESADYNTIRNEAALKDFQSYN